MKNAVYIESCVLMVITQRVDVISYRRFGKTYRSHLKGSRIVTESRLKPSHTVFI